MDIDKLFGDLYSTLSSEVDQLTGDRSFAGYVTLRIEDEDKQGAGWERSIRCQHNTGPLLGELKRIEPRKSKEGKKRSQAKIKALPIYGRA
jgi:hypothetical protein